MDERVYWLGFSVFPGVGPKRFSELLAHFGSAKVAWVGEEVAIQKILGKVYGDRFIEFRMTFSLEKYQDRLREQDVWFVTLLDKEYPPLLAGIRNPPFVLYGIGARKILHRRESDRKYIGVVGTRRVSSYGRQVTEMITEDLVLAGCVIVSGLAMGVDAIAHTTTVKNNGSTIAVLGSGVDVCHPSVNENIYQSIITRGGVIVSEYPLGEPPSKGSFPSRNRIIAGLSDGVVLTEGSVDSGALYTTSDAFASGRPVFAVPGPITSSLSIAPNSLLAQGAKLVTNGNDILDSLGIMQRIRSEEKKSIKGDTDEEQRIIDLLTLEALAFDEIVKRTGFATSKAGMCLSMMELRGIISNIQGNYTLIT